MENHPEKERDTGFYICLVRYTGAQFGFNCHAVSFSESVIKLYFLTSSDKMNLDHTTKSARGAANTYWASRSTSGAANTY